HSNDKKREKCFFTQSDGDALFVTSIPRQIHGQTFTFQYVASKTFPCHTNILTNRRKK
ncbi:MAG: hypothetical protein GX925_06360, partial [Clostridiales bacterium]|nr:hypothetical protein [Clostridiales bacterium]